MAEFASNAKGNAALTTGIIGASGVGLGLLSNLMGGGVLGVSPRMCVEGDAPVSQREMKLVQENAALRSDADLLRANIYNDQKSLEMYRYIDGELKEIRGELCKQAVHNQRTEDSFVIARQDIAAVKAELSEKICAEVRARKCADNSIVNYANATFYPKMVADVTVGTATTAQTLYNPLPADDCCC